jgi:transposase
LSWQKIYAGVSPEVQTVAPDQDAEITRSLANLQKYVSDLYTQESQEGKRFSLEEVDILNAEGQRRATAIAGQIAQVAARLGIVLKSD